jgi:hypothetical protein
MKEKKYKVYMSLPSVWCVVEATNKEDAIEKAIDKNMWNEQEEGYGGEDYTAKLLKPKNK